MISTIPRFMLLGTALAAGLGVSLASESLPIDRWLVAGPIVADSDSQPDGDPLASDLLEAPGESGVLPDRGREAAGLTWTMLRQDGQARFDLSERLGDAPDSSVLYAHAYIRLPEDRTLRIDATSECGGRRVWLNGRPLDGEAAEARFGLGWNTLLVKTVTGDCPAVLAAILEATAEGGLDGIRVQASRPYGEVRTGPEAWLTAADTAVVADGWRWRDDRLYAGLVVPVTAWGRSPVSGVEVKLEGRVEGRAEAEWLVPGSPTDVVVPVRLDRMDRVLGDRIEARVEWRDGRREVSLALVGKVPAESQRVDLDGWEVRGVTAAARTETIDGRLPNAAGWLLAGKWKVPERLAGTTLRLHVGEGPADYRINGSDTRFDGNLITLCSACRKGFKIELTARSTGGWSAMPHVLVSRGD